MATTLLASLAFPSRQGARPSRTPEPSYAELAQVFQSGQAKQVDTGWTELSCNQATNPSGWIWAVDDTRDGDGVEYWILHTSFPFPGPTNNGVEIQFNYISGFIPTDLASAKAWIVANNSHVQSAAELTVHKCDVSLVP